MNSGNNEVLKTPLLSGCSADEKREEIKAYFRQTWEMYEALFACINHHDAYYLRPEPLRHPLIFYYGHTATFFINKLVLGQFLDHRINEAFESMFAIGVDEMSWDDLDTRHYDWPRVNAVGDYRNQVKDVVGKLMDSMPLELPLAKDSLAWIILMGIEHERIHLETSSVLIRMLPLHCVQQSKSWTACTRSGIAPANHCLPVSGQTVKLGRADENDHFGWDNEYGSKDVPVSDFFASQFLVSNQEFLGFMEAGGYQDKRWWTEEGLQWLAYAKAVMPRFWSFHDGQFWQRNLLEEIPLPSDWPVEVNYLEAKAFCNWKSCAEKSNIRLPTEAEWVLLRSRMDTDAMYWKKAPGNINLEHFASSCPVNIFKNDGFYDLIGNVWQWTESRMDGYPGFNVHKLYDDFSIPTFDGLHNLIKGGSWISTGNLATRHARYAFRRHFFQHAGFRYVRSPIAEVPAEAMNTYESDFAVSQYLEFHYGDEYFGVPNFPRACIASGMAFVDRKLRNRALDLGCSVGRATLELANCFAHVDGIDFSTRFVQQGVTLLKEGLVRYSIVSEGDLREYREVSLAGLGFSQPINNVDFIQGDACNLKPIYTGYDLVFCGNLIDRLYDPALFLKGIAKRLVPGGILILTSPYTWLEEFTAKSKWLGGVKVNGENQGTLEGLKTLLSPQFNLLEVSDVPFVIRETRRKFQHSIAQMTVWQLKEANMQ